MEMYRYILNTCVYILFKLKQNFHIANKNSRCSMTTGTPVQYNISFSQELRCRASRGGDHYQNKPNVLRWNVNIEIHRRNVIFKLIVTWVKRGSNISERYLFRELENCKHKLIEVAVDRTYAGNGIRGTVHDDEVLNTKNKH